MTCRLLFRNSILCLLSLLLSSSAFAALKMMLWSPLPTAPLLIFVPEGQTPQSVAQRYIEEMRQDSEMRNLFKDKFPVMALEKFREVQSGDLQKSVLLLANTATDLSYSSKRVNNFKRLFKRQQQPTYVLPLRIDLALTAKEAEEMRDLIAHKIPTMVAMGGDDVEPALYRQDKTLARNTLPERDKAEVAIIKAYLKAEKGFLLSICRGDQLSSVALGYQLIQDIPTMVEDHEAHANDVHPIQLRKTTFSRLLSLFPSGRIQVNSFHHQAVQFHPGGPLEVAAVAADGVIEALEMKNGHGLFLQFHPELMEDDIGYAIMDQVAVWKNQPMLRSCARIH